MGTETRRLADAPTHPRFRERRAEVEDQTIRSRQRKIIALAVAGVAVLLAFAATQSALLDVDEVRIVGAEQTSPDALRAVAAVELGTPVLGLDTGAVEARLLALPEIRSASASAGWGGVLTIEIAERLAVARIESAAGTIVVAADGIVLEVIERAVSDADPVDGGPVDPGAVDGGAVDAEPIMEPLPPTIDALPEISGAIFTIEAGEALPAVLDDAVTVAAALPDDISAVTERVEVTVDSLLLRAVGGGSIALGDARDLDEKFSAVRAFLAQADLTCLETLNVRAPSAPVIRRTSNC